MTSLKRHIPVRISDPSYAHLLDLAEIPHDHHRQTAKGLSDWVSTLLLVNPPTSWHDCRPPHVQQSDLEDLTRGPSNLRYWIMSPHPRLLRGLLLPSTTLPLLYPIALHLSLIPQAFTPGALLGALLETLGSGWVQADYIPPPPDSVNLHRRALALKRYHLDDHNSQIRAERYPYS